MSHIKIKLINPVKNLIESNKLETKKINNLLQ